jgi:hypothetical protein
MAVFAPDDTPEGWIQFPDGSIGPPNSVGSDWNAPYRIQNGINPPSPSALGRPNVGPGMGYPAAGISPQGTSLNTTGPQIFPPNQRPINPTRQVGPFTGGTSTENAWDPRNWFKADPNATFKAGSPMNEPGGPAAGNFPNITSLLGGGNPLWKGAIAAGGVLTPTPAETGEFTPAEPNFVRPDAPRGGGLPAPAAPAATINPNTDTSPYAQPSRPVTPYPTPLHAPGAIASTPGPINGKINPASVNLGNNPWITASRPNMSPQNSAQGRQGAPQMGMFDLSQIFNHPAVAAAAAAHPTVQGMASGQIASLGPTPYPGPTLNPSGRLSLTGGNRSGPNDYRTAPTPTPPLRPTTGRGFWPTGTEIGGSGTST